MTVTHVASHGVGTGENSSIVTNVMVTARPPGVPLQAGDVLITFLRHQTSLSTTDAVSSGWTRISTPFVPQSIAARIVGIYMRRVENPETEPTSYTWTIEPTGRWASVTSIFRSSTGATIQAGSYSTSYSGLSVTGGRALGEVSTAFAGIQVAMWASEFSASQNHVFSLPPTSFAKLADYVSSAGSLEHSRTYLWAGRRAVAAGTIPSDMAQWATANGAGAQSVVLYESEAEPPPPEQLVVPVWDGAEEVPHLASVWTGTEEKIVTQIMALPHRGYTITEMDADIAAGRDVFWSHRGGSLNWPEMTLRAYTNSIWHGAKVLEASYVRSQDGVWVASHDVDLVRVTGNTALTDLRQLPASAALGQPVLVPTAAPDAVVERLEDLLQTYPQFVLLLDHKTGTAYQTFMQIIKDNVPNWQDHVILKIAGASAASRFQEAQAAGFKTAAYFYDTDVQADITTKMPYVDYPGLNVTADQSWWDFILSFGKPVWAHVLQSASGYTQGKSKGAKIFQCANVLTIIPKINQI